MIKLKNQTKTIQCFNLPHEEQFLQDITHKFPEFLPDGKTAGIRETTKKLPGSITILAGETIEVHDAAINGREIKSAIAKGVLKAIPVQQQNSQAPAPQPEKSNHHNQPRRR